MFIAERLIGVLIYGLCLLFICLLIIKLTVKCKSLLKFYAIMLCAMAYLYTPYQTADLYRIFNIMDYFSTMEFAEFFEQQVVTSSTPIAELMYWTFAKIGDYHLLPASTCFIVYSLLFSILEKTRAKFSVSRANAAIALFFLMSTSIYMSAIGGIRMMLAMSIIVYCFFQETVERKFGVSHVFLYAIAFLTHSMAVVIIGIRFISMLMKKKTNMAKRLVYAVFIVGIALAVASKMNWVVLNTFNKAMGFLTGDSYYDVWEYVIGFAFMVLALIVIKRYGLLERSGEEMGTYNVCLKLSVFIAIIFFFEFSIFYRFIGHLMPLLLLPSMMVIFENPPKKKRQKEKFSLQSIVLIVSTIALAINVTRGSLSALKFFEFTYF